MVAGRRGVPDYRHFINCSITTLIDSVEFRCQIWVSVVLGILRESFVFTHLARTVNPAFQSLALGSSGDHPIQHLP